MGLWSTRFSHEGKYQKSLDQELRPKRKDMTLLDAAILMNPQVWVASGHVGGFSDPLIDDKKTKERFRADKLLEDFDRKSKTNVY
jgi:glycyl-tRNA synthetase (class II)